MTLAIPIVKNVNFARFHQLTSTQPQSHNPRKLHHKPRQVLHLNKRIIRLRIPQSVFPHNTPFAPKSCVLRPFLLCPSNIGLSSQKEMLPHEEIAGPSEC